MANDLPTVYQELIWDWTWNRLKVDRLQDVEYRFGEKFADWTISSRNKLTNAQGADPDIPIYTGSLGLIISSVLTDTYQHWNLVIDSTTNTVLSEEYVEFVGGTDISTAVSGTGTLADPYLVTIASTYSPAADEYVNSISFNTSDGVLTLGRAVGSDLTEDLDGRYALEHTHPYDDYDSWEFRTDGIKRKDVTTGGIVDLVGGDNISIVYSADGIATIGTTIADNYLNAIDATNISGVKFTLANDDEIITSFDHSHIQYMLAGSQKRLIFNNGIDGEDYNGEEIRAVKIGDLIGSPTGIIYTN